MYSTYFEELADKTDEEIQDYYYENDLTDGLPIFIPNNENVNSFILANGYSPETEIGIIDPKRGVATINNIAVNAVMAGCKPEYFPVIISIVKAICKPIFNLHSIQCTTNPATPLTIINGPIISKIKANFGRNLLGPGNRANATIGRAIRLILKNIGGAIDGIDMATHGSPAKYSLCFAEDENAIDWPSLHEDLGYEKSQSVVSLFGIESVINSTAVWWDANSLIKMLSKTLRSTATSQFFSRGSLVLLMSPAHAGVFLKKGYSKQEFREHLWELSKVPITDFPESGNIPQGDWTVIKDKVLICEKPDDLNIVIGGGNEGNASHSVFFSGFCLSKRSSEIIN